MTMYKIRISDKYGGKALMKKSGFTKVIIAIVIFVVAFLSGSSIYKVISNKKNGAVRAFNQNQAIIQNVNVQKDSIERKNQLSKDKEMIEYKGTIEHVFFHPLILDNELAFKGPKWQTDDMDDWFVTVQEFKSILNSIYEKGYILVDPNKLYEPYEKDGKKLLRKKTIKVPKGKKPLILSIDDLSYNEGMRKATALKLILDDKGELATYRKDRNSKVQIGYNETVIIIDEFVKNHPDFSLDGTKGVIALTGYQGVFGYRTERTSPNRQSEINEAKKIANKLKENGWSFASHSYGHNPHDKISLEKLKTDADHWESEVKNVVGDTQIYIYPHGDSIKESGPKFNYLHGKGFNLFYSVDSASTEIISKKLPVVHGGRLAIDGVSMRNRRQKFLKFFDAKVILDLKSRPNRPFKFE
ncbi:hypothetical protein ADU80_02730 [Clostridium botulinum]|uniref:NodB homology domain-containing protein n=2 Tax=Clostridium botulinum TaxID=1491 RepID=A0A9Q1V0K1_CLOBO|nr:conserved protein [Clostridium botulinum BKT015925]KEI05427.1 hypothetical protein Y848_09050 [Clostridium botulinum C/D str. Sp77]KLU75165.1 hypothetical protein CBC3_10400 [Clostridium botulinum V891]KOA73338.1 hypothetical protein ADU78_12650 [Clostridium botulinum]KOA80713.1 hypothetical protein ADU77_00770 [Clostridium botulinum]